MQQQIKADHFFLKLKKFNRIFFNDLSLIHFNGHDVWIYII